MRSRSCTNTPVWLNATEPIVSSRRRECSILAENRSGGPMRRFVLFGGCLLLGLLALTPVKAQDFPARPLRLIVPSPPGGGTDIIGRNVAQSMTERFRFPAYVENKPGAGSLV